MSASVTIFPPVLVNDLITKVTGRSSLARLSQAKPIAFTGQKEFTFSMDKEIDIVAENGAKSHGGLTVSPVTIVPIKFEYGARISQEFLIAGEEQRISLLEAFNDGFAKKVARGLDLAAFHGVNPRTGSASAVVGTNHFDGQVNRTVTFAPAAPDGNLEAAIELVRERDGEITGMALAPKMATAMSKMLAGGGSNARLYPEFAFGANPQSFHGMSSDVNSTVNSMVVSGNDYAILGDFSSGFKWGYSKEIPLKVIEYGDPDNSGSDLQGHNQVYLRAEVYLGWGILVPDWFCRVVTRNGEDKFNGTGSKTSFELGHDPVMIHSVKVGDTETAYTANGKTITFGDAPASGTENVVVQYEY